MIFKGLFQPTSFCDSTTEDKNKNSSKVTTLELCELSSCSEFYTTIPCIFKNICSLTTDLLRYYSIAHFLSTWSVEI